MKNNYSVSLVLLGSVLLQSRCQAQPVASSIRSASEEEMAQVIPKWMEKRCNVRLGFFGFVENASSRFFVLLIEMSNTKWRVIA